MSTTIAIPDGFSKDGQSLVVSLMLTPCDMPSLGLKIMDWPGSVAKSVKSRWLPIHIQLDGGATRTIPARVRDNWPNGDASAASKLWGETFGERWEFLTDVLSGKSPPLMQSGNHLATSVSYLADHLSELHIQHSSLRYSVHAQQRMEGLFPEATSLISSLRTAAKTFPFRDPLYLPNLKLAAAIVPREMRSDAIGRSDSISNGVRPNSLAALMETMRKESYLPPEKRESVQIMRRPFPKKSIWGAHFDVIPETTDLLASHIAASLLAHPLENTRPSPSDNVTAVKRALAAIHAHPTVAKFLGLILDLEFRVPSDWPAEARGAIAVGFCERSAKFVELNRTAFFYSAKARDGLFVARTRDGTRYVGDSNPSLSVSDPNDIVIDKGVVRLDPDRFKLERINADLLLNALLQQSSAHLESHTSGGEETAGSGFPESQSRGIHLLDRKAADREFAAQNRTKITSALGTKSRTLFAEDLCIGFRADCRRETAQGPAKQMPWATLTGRTVYVREIWEAFNTNHDDHPYPDVRDRDHGLVRPAIRTVPSSDPKNPNTSGSDVIFVWKNEPLGLPAAQGNENDTVTGGTDEILPLTMEYDLPAELAVCPPVLRFGSRYKFGLRAVMLNGSSVPLEVAACQYDSKDPHLTIGDGAQLFSYGFVEKVLPPAVLVSSDDPLVALPKKTDGRIGLEDHRIVLRPGAEPMRRFLIPGRRPFDFVEQCGLFDQADQRSRDTPYGAFLGFARNKDGDFPSRLHGNPQTDGPGSGSDSKVLEPTNTPPETEENPYYPDPIGRVVCFGFERQGANAPGFGQPGPMLLPSDPKPLGFWRPDQSATNARPFVVQVQRSQKIEVQASYTEQFGELYPTLTVGLPEGEQVNLWYWAIPDSEVMAQSHHLTRLRTKWGWSNKVIAVTEGQTPFNTISGRWGKIELIHAVERSAKAVAFRRVDSLRARSSSNLDAPGGITGYQDEGTVAVLRGLLAFDRRVYGQLTFSVACEDYSALRIEKRGDKYVEVIPVRTEEVLPRDLPISVDAKPGQTANDDFDLFEDDSNRPRSLHVDFHDTAARRLVLRCAATSRFIKEFSKKKKVSDFQVVSGPAFPKSGSIDFTQYENANCWLLSTAHPPPPTVARTEWLVTEVPVKGRGGSRGIQQRFRLRVHLDGKWFAQGEDEMLAVVFPPKGIDTVEGYKATSRSFEDNGLVCGTNTWPNCREAASLKYLLDLRAIEFEKSDPLGTAHKYEKYADQVTRWGTDPTTTQAGVAGFMLPERFHGHTGRRADLTLPLSPPPDLAGDPDAPRKAPAGEVPVSVLLYETKFDTNTGKRYADIEINVDDYPTPEKMDTGAHMAFVRLALARYQPHSMPGLELSMTQVIDPVRVPASRTVEVSIKDKQTVGVKISGKGYSDRSICLEGFAALDMKRRKLLQMPLMNIQLLRQDAKSNAFVACFGKTGERGGLDGAPERLIQSAAGPGSEGQVSFWYRLPQVTLNSDLTWDFTLSLPIPVDKQRYALQIDEVELHVPDTVTRPSADSALTEPEPDNNYVFEDNMPTRFVEKPQMFSCHYIF